MVRVLIIMVLSVPVTAKVSELLLYSISWWMSDWLDVGGWMVWVVVMDEWVDGWVDGRHMDGCGGWLTGLVYGLVLLYC